VKLEGKTALITGGGAGIDLKWGDA